MEKHKILISIGTRPNFIKVTQFKKYITDFPQLEIKILHTGQHYDYKMAKVFFDQFKMEPVYFLEIGEGSPSQQIGKIILAFEEFVKNVYQPDLVLVPGDVNSTLAVAIACNKLGISIGHIESGLRSFDRTMPEEFNRLVADELADICFVTESSGIENLKLEQKKGQIYFVGNTMIDTMVAFENNIDESSILSDFKISNAEYCLCTFHRPALVDEPQGLKFLVNLLESLSDKITCVFPIHPRTKKNLIQQNKWETLANVKNLILLDPIGYFEFQKLVKRAKLILTDSRGIQEESAYRKVPCLTLRPNTERQITVEEGSNILLPMDIEMVNRNNLNILSGKQKKSEIPELWDGKSTFRILKTIENWRR